MAEVRGGADLSTAMAQHPRVFEHIYVNMIRAGAGIEPFQREDAEELVQYAVRRGLIGADEGDQVLADIAGKGSRKGRASAGGKKARSRGPARKSGSARPVSRRPVKKKATTRR